MTPTQRKIHWAAPVLALTLGACATTTAPLTLLDDAQALTARARSADAARHAPVELRFAEDKLSRARSAADARDYKLATTLAQQAAVDAEFAIAKTQEVRAREAARAQREENARLRHDLLGEGDSP